MSSGLASPGLSRCSIMSSEKGRAVEPVIVGKFRLVANQSEEDAVELRFTSDFDAFIPPVLAGMKFSQEKIGKPLMILLQGSSTYPQFEKGADYYIQFLKVPKKD
jgi:hypothetical protein